MNRPLVCMRCRAFYGSRHLVVPGDVTIKIPTPEGEIEAVRQDHGSYEECLIVLRQEASRQKEAIEMAQGRLRMIQDAHNTIVDMQKRDKEKRVPRREVQ